jgi:predicted SnoaL-like aldol condensation-catalyzing enzyme
MEEKIKDAKGVVYQYFKCLDEKNIESASQLFSPNCEVYFPSLTFKGQENWKISMTDQFKVFNTMASKIEEMIIQGNLVAARVFHTASYRENIQTDMGIIKAAGKTASWRAIATFKMDDNLLIQEEWIMRDEVGLIKQLGIRPNFKSVLMKMFKKS